MTIFECKIMSKIEWIFATERRLTSRLLLLGAELLRLLLLLLLLHHWWETTSTCSCSSSSLRHHIHSIGTRPRLGILRIHVHETTHCIVVGSGRVVLSLGRIPSATSSKIQTLREILIELRKWIIRCIILSCRRRLLLLLLLWTELRLLLLLLLLLRLLWALV